MKQKKYPLSSKATVLSRVSITNKVECFSEDWRLWYLYCKALLEKESFRARLLAIQTHYLGTHRIDAMGL